MARALKANFHVSSAEITTLVIKPVEEIQETNDGFSIVFHYQ